MNKIFAMLLSVLAMTFIASCGGGNGTKDAKAVAKAADKGTPTSLNIRYVDGDSIGAKYNFAKDIQEAIMRAQSRQEQAEKAKSAELQKYGEKVQALASQIDNKMRNNGYLSEISMSSDQKKYEQMMTTGQRMQASAQNYLAGLARNSQNEIMQLQMQLQDSIESFIRDYNAKKGYDAILYKAAGVYFNPSLDITDEVIEGLNARYNKK